MTVCVAAIYENGKVICATDRMLTLFEDWQWQMEPDDSKLFHLGASHAVMYAGNSSLALEVIRELVAHLKPDARGPMDDLPTVATVADEYSKAWGRVKRQRMEREILGVHKMSFAQYEREKPSLRPVVAERIQSRIDGFAMPLLHAIIAGVDETGIPHLWMADGEKVWCVDVPGFAAIGIGYTIAYAELMTRHSGRGMKRGEAALLTYAAKKKADQTVGGVGPATNVFTLGPDAGKFAPWMRAIIDLLDVSYEGLLRAEGKGFTDAALEVQTLLSGPTIPPMPPAIPDTPSPARPEASTPDSSPQPPLRA